MGSSNARALDGLDEGLRVRHIANFPLITCKADDDAEELFGRPDYKDFDQMPIAEGNRIVGIVERSKPKVRRALDDSVLVAADNPLSNFIHTVHQQPYRLVVDGTAITGIVTWSDLLKLPVTVLAFSLVAELELAMNCRIKERYGDQSGWLELLNKEERDKILGRLRRLQQENLALSLLELADFPHKATVLRQLFSATRDFVMELESLKSLRNEVAHVKEIARGDADLKIFVERIETAEAWLKILQSNQALPAVAG